MLSLTNLTGFGGRVVTPPSISATGSGIATPNGSTSTSKTLTGVSFGAAEPRRVIIIMAGAGDGSSGVSVASTSCTIGGITATKIAEVATTQATRHVVSCYAAIVPTGTSGNVVVNYANAVFDCAIGVYRAMDVDISGPATYNFTQSSTTSMNLGLNVPENCIVVGGFSANGSNMSGGNAVWSVLTEDWEYQAGNVARRQGGASATISLAQTLSVNLTGLNGGGSELNAMLLVSLGPLS